MPKRRNKGLRSEFAAIRRALGVLERAFIGLSSTIDAQGSRGLKQPVRGKRKLTVTPARLKALKLHGRYLGYIRQLKPRQRAEVKAVREKKGVEAAIKRARKFAGS